MTRSRLARRSISLFAQSLEDRTAPALFGPIDKSVNVGKQPYSVAVADFNHDGNLDIATANSTTYDVTVLLGDGANGFSPAPGSPFGVGANPESVAVGDFNGDGKPDLAVANWGNNNVSVLLGAGNGAFTQAPGSPFAVGTRPTSLATGDLNGDGNVDLVVANNGSNNVTVLLGTGSGGFNEANGSPFGSGTKPNSVAVGDFDGDGRPDIVVANYGSNDLTQLLGDGSGGFSPASDSPIAVGAGPAFVAVGDLNGDGRLDLAVANFGPSSVTVLLGDGSSGFGPAPGSPFATGTNPISISIGDLNGDGRSDLVTADFSSKSATVLLGGGSGDFKPAPGSPFAVESNPDSVAIGDFNGDGLPDFVAADAGSNDVTVHLNHGGTSTTLYSSSSQAIYGQQFTLTAFVVNSHGDPISGNVIFDYGTGSLGPVPVISGRATLTIGAGTLLPAGTYSFKAVLLGSPEYFTSESPPLEQVVIKPPTITSFSPPNKPSAAGQKVTLTALVTSTSPIIPQGSAIFRDGATVIGTAPLTNGVATLDWSFGTTGTHMVTVQYRESDFNFLSSISPVTPVTVAGTAHKIVTGTDAGGLPLVNVFSLDGTLERSFLAYTPTFKGGLRVAAGDVNGDGVDDIIVSPGAGGGPLVKVYDGIDGHQIRAFYATAPSFKGGIYVAAGDVNGDGYSDIVCGVGLGGAPHVKVFDGRTAATLFDLPAYPSTFHGGVRVAVGDIDGDGKAEIITSPAKGAGQNVRIFSGKANAMGGHDELFNLPTPYGAKYSGGITVAVGDLDGDGRADIILGSGTGLSPNVKVFGSKTHTFIWDSAVDLGDNFKGGVRVAAGDVNGDGVADVIVGSGVGGAPQIQVIDGTDLSTVLWSNDPYVETFTGGVWVG
jgi:hypothetical protein